MLHKYLENAHKFYFSFLALHFIALACLQLPK